MVYFGVDLYRFSLICNDCFRKVVYKKEKGDKQIVLTPSISESNIKFLKISSLFPPVAMLRKNGEPTTAVWTGTGSTSGARPRRP